MDDFFGGVDRTVVHVEAGRHAAFVKSCPQRFDEGIDILSREKLAVTADARSVIQESAHHTLRSIRVTTQQLILLNNSDALML